MGLVITLVVWPNEFQKATGFHLAYVSSASDGSVDLTMLRPRYLGTDARNQPFVVTANSATQDPKDQRLITLIKLQADMSMADGRWFTVMADNGIYHQQKQFFGQSIATELLPNTRYDLIAQALGAHGEFVQDSSQLAPALKRAFASTKPSVINVKTTPSPSPLTKWVLDTKQY